MVDTKLIVFEGIDNSGKTSVSQEVLRILQEDAQAVGALYSREDSNEELRAYVSNPANIWGWSKEPTFSTEEADRLNDGDMDQNEREVLFLASRIRQQPLYKRTSVVLDRYLWTGMAYAKMFSPDCYDFSTKLYNGESDMFKIPDLTIFIDTPVETCHEREPSVSIERLNGIRDAYMGAREFVKGPVETLENTGTLEEAVDKAMVMIKSHFYTAESDRMQIGLEFPTPGTEVVNIRQWKDKKETESE